MYCPACGAEHADDAIACPGCGRAVSAAPASQPVSEPVPVKSTSTLKTVAKIFMLVDSLWFVIFLLIPVYGWIAFVSNAIGLAWKLPMTIKFWRSVQNHTPVSTAFKVCSLIFVSPVAGILMLCDHED